jgi:hypothetical protein
MRGDGGASEGESDGRLTHRREFVRWLAVGGASGVLVSEGESAFAAAHSQDPAEAADRTSLDAEVEARLAIVLARYGAVLDDATRLLIQADIRLHVTRARRLKSFALENGDAPFPVLIPYRSHS